jgi:transcriptional regulator with XRE-family HTH domain
MTTTFALDLRLARRKAGFTQRDSAHLLGVTTAKLALLEAGRRLPSITQICTLSVIYGRSFESLFAAILEDARQALRGRILLMPTNTRAYAGTRNRDFSIDRLAQQLAAARNDHDA